MPRILAGRYEIGELIGRGGMAEVHVGRDARLGRTVAIKLLRSDLAKDPSFQARFRREAQAAASLNHPAIVAVYDTGEDISTDPAGITRHTPYIIMEYVEGHTLRELMRDGSALPIDEALDITIGVLSALQYAHHAGIVHRDIKPANIMLTAAGQVKVMDFGIARALSDNTATVTQSQAVIGTAQYLSPEQARGETVDARSDLYSTGCVLFELLTGRPPFTGDSAVAIAYQHVREQPAPPSTYAPDVPSVLDRIVLKALSKDRNLRYSTASEFLADLQAAKNGERVAAPMLAPLVAPTDETAVLPADATRATEATPAFRSLVRDQADQAAEDEEAAAKRKRKKILIIIGSIVAAILIGLIVWMVVSNSHKSPGPSTSPSATSTQVDVPAVPSDRSEEAAVKALKDAKLEPVRSEAFDAEVPAGQVIRFAPESGTSVATGTKVTYVVSLGSEFVEIRDVRNTDQATARKWLTDDGLVVADDVENIDDKDVEANKVVGTRPAAHEQVNRGATVTLLISTGRTTVPDFTGMNEAEYREHLDASGLSLAGVTEQTSDQPPGTVIGQSLTAHTSVPQHSDIQLTVAKAPIKVTLPDLTGRSQAYATDLLNQLGLDEDIATEQSTSVAQGIVIRTEPPGNTEMNQGATVRVIVSAGPGPGQQTNP
jgi:serine/threonine-protein kinase